MVAFRALKYIKRYGLSGSLRSVTILQNVGLMRDTLFAAAFRVHHANPFSIV